MIVRVEDVPGVIDAGLGVAEMPVGGKIVDKNTEEVKPFLGVIVTDVVPDDPAAMLTVEGVATTEYAGPLTATCIVRSWKRPLTWSWPKM